MPCTMCSIAQRDMHQSAKPYYLNIALCAHGCMRVRVRACMAACTRACMHATHTHTCMKACIHTYLYGHTHIRKRALTCTHSLSLSRTHTGNNVACHADSSSVIEKLYESPEFVRFQATFSRSVTD